MCSLSSLRLLKIGLVNLPLPNASCMMLLYKILTCRHIMYYVLLCARHYKPQLVYFLPHFGRTFFVFKEFFSENFVFICGKYPRVVSNQERVIMERKRYLVC